MFKHFKKVLPLCVLLFTFSFTLNVSSASALTSEQIQAIISLVRSFGGSDSVLQNVEDSLYGRTPATSPQTTTPAPTFCYTFTRYLAVGISLREAEAHALGFILKKEGVLQFSNVSRFDDDVAAAVVGFQEKYGITRTGTVGPITRAKLNSLYGCGNQIEPFIKSIEPSSAGVGSTVTIHGTGLYLGNAWNEVYVVFNNPQTDSSVHPTTISFDGTKITFIVPSLASGSYNVSIEGKGRRSNYLPFSIIRSTTQPSITVLSPNGGESWQKGTAQTIKWQDNTPLPACSISQTAPCLIVRQYDIKLASYYAPCTGTVCPAYPYREPYFIAKGVSGISYNWGAGKIIDIYGTGDTAPDGYYNVQVCQTGTTTCDSSDSYFKISSGTTQPSITVLSPNGGESLVKGQIFKIAWQSSGINAVGLNLVDLDTGREYEIGTAPASSGYYNWTIPSTLPDGSKYIVTIATPDVDQLIDSSNSSFTITAPQLSSTEILNKLGEAVKACVGSVTSNCLDFDFNDNALITISDVNMLKGLHLISDVDFQKVFDKMIIAYSKRLTTSGGDLNFDLNNDGKILTNDVILARNAMNSARTKPFVTITSPISGTTVGKVFSVSGRCPNYQGNVSVYYYSTQKISQDVPCLNSQWGTSITLDTNAGSGSFDLYAALSSGEQTQRTLLFIIDPNTQPSITVLSPNGGEVWSIGSQQQIRWTTTGSWSASATGIIRLIPLAGGSVVPVATNVSLSSGSHSWLIPSTISPGKYNLHIYCTNFTDCKEDMSATSFDISGAPSFSADIKVNGSDNPFAIVPGTSFTIAWSSVGTARCNGYGYGEVRSVSDQRRWTDMFTLQSSGSDSFTNKITLPGNSFMLGVQCWDSLGKSVSDEIIVSISAGVVMPAVINIAPAPSITQNVTAGESNQFLGAFVVDVKNEPVKIADRLVFEINTNGAEINPVTSVYLVDENNNSIAGPVDATLKEGQIIVFNTALTFPLGIHTYTLRGKIPAVETNGKTYSLTTVPAAQWYKAIGAVSNQPVILTPSVLTLGSVKVVSTPSLVGSTESLGLRKDQVAQVYREKFTTRVSEANGNIPISISSVSPSSAKGGTVTLSDTYIIYTPPAGYIGEDTFTFVITDGKGRFATSTVRVHISEVQPLTDAEIIKSIQVAVLNNLCPVVGICDLNLDMNNDSKVTSADVLIVGNVLTQSYEQFDTVYKKIKAAVSERIGLTTGATKFIAEFDINKNGTIEQSDWDRISKALIGTRVYPPVAQPLTDAEIVKSLALMITTRLCVTPCDSTFDFTGEGSVMVNDVIFVANSAGISDDFFEKMYRKMQAAVAERFTLKTGDTKFIAEFDIDKNGTIEQSDWDRISKALIGSRVYPPVVATTALTPEAVSAIAAFSQKQNLNLANILQAIEQLIVAFQ